MLPKFSMGCKAPEKKRGRKSGMKKKLLVENIEGWAENPMQQEGLNFERAVESIFSVKSCAVYSVGMLTALHFLPKYFSSAKCAEEVCFSDVHITFIIVNLEKWPKINYFELVHFQFLSLPNVDFWKILF